MCLMAKKNKLKEFLLLPSFIAVSVFLLLVVVAREEKKIGDGCGGGCNGGDRLQK